MTMTLVDAAAVDDGMGPRAERPKRRTFTAEFKVKILAETRPQTAASAVRSCAERARTYTRRLIWAAPGRDRDALRSFVDELGSQRCAQISHISAVAADWGADVVAQLVGLDVGQPEAGHGAKVLLWVAGDLQHLRDPDRRQDRLVGGFSRREVGDSEVQVVDAGAGSIDRPGQCFVRS